jgi:uncharacterized repeat protein (TIGR01451 family)
MLVLALTPAARAVPNPDIFYVNTTSDVLHPTSDCLYQSVAPCSLRDAVTLAGNHSVDAYVELGASTYTLADPSGSTGYLPISGTIGHTAHKVFISGTTGTVIDDSGNGGNPAMAGGGGNGGDSLELDYLTLTGAQQTPAFEWQGVGNVTLQSVSFTNNHIQGAAAAMFVSEVGTLKMSSVTFTGNHGDQEQFGAGLDVEGVQGAANLSGLQFINNVGAAFLATQNSGPVNLSSARFIGNSNSSRATLEIDSGAAPSSVQDVTVEGNSTTLPFSTATVTLRGPFSKLDGITINGNTAATDGGAALLNLTGTAPATNWTVSGNQVTGSGSTAAVAGGIDVSGGTLRLNHATVAENSAAGNADDLRTSGTGTIDVLNSIVDGSSAGGAVACAHDGGPIVSLGHNLDRGGSCGFSAAGDHSNLDPVLGPLTMPLFVGQATARPLGYGSPAVNAADSANCPPTDALGTARPQGSACDIGSFEATLANLSVALGVDHTSLPAGGGQVTYRATVSNLASTVPQTVTFSDRLPGGVHATSATASQGTCTTTPAVSCALGAVHRGTDVTVTIVAKLSASGAQVDSAHVQSELPDSDIGNDTATATTNVAAPPRVVPVLSHLSVSPRSFRPDPAHGKRRRGATIAYHDSAAATTTLTFLRRLPGVRAGRACVAPHHARRQSKPHRCMRLVAAGTLRHGDKAGANSIHFSGRIGGRALSPGTYTLRAVARLAPSRKSKSVQIGFAIR